MLQEIAVPEDVGMNSQGLQHIRPAMQAYIDRKKIAGLSTMIARRGEVVHFEQVGEMDIESGTPMAPDAIFRLYSMTKPIVTAALMTLNEQAKFQLDDPVAKFIPAFGNLKVLTTDEAGQSKEEDLARPVTIRHLLTHTAGLTYDFMEDTPVAELYRQAGLMNQAQRSLEELVARLAQLPLAYQPGTRWHYSLGIDVAARLIEVLSGQSLGKYLSRVLFNPLGMVDTGFYVPPENEQRIATMYGLPDLWAAHMTFSKLNEAWNKGFNERIDVSGTNPSSVKAGFARGGTGLFSTAWDYLRFAQMLLNRGELNGVRVLNPQTVNLMVENHLPAALLPYGEPPSLGYGFGLGCSVLMDVAATQQPGSVGEFAWGGAAKTVFWVDPQEELVVILMSQSMIQFETPEKELRLLTYQALAA